MQTRTQLSLLSLSKAVTLGGLLLKPSSSGFAAVLWENVKFHPKCCSLWWGLLFYHRRTICSECALSRARRVSAQGCALFFVLVLFYEWVSKAAAGRVTECMYMAPGEPLLKRTALPVDSLWLIPSSLFPLTQHSPRVLLNSLWSHWDALLRHHSNDNLDPT